MENHISFNQTFKDLCLKLAHFILTTNYEVCVDLGCSIVCDFGRSLAIADKAISLDQSDYNIEAQPSHDQNKLRRVL